jgi:hypothetical protein
MHWCMYIVEASASTEYAWHLFMSLTLVGKLSVVEASASTEYAWHLFMSLTFGWKVMVKIANYHSFFINICIYQNSSWTIPEHLR